MGSVTPLKSRAAHGGESGIEVVRPNGPLEIRYSKFYLPPHIHKMKKKLHKGNIQDTQKI